MALKALWENRKMSYLIKNKETNSFFDNVAQTIEDAHRIIGRTVNLTMCVTNFEIGRQIVEEEQGGELPNNCDFRIPYRKPEY